MKEQEVQLMINRLAMLEAEEENIRKKISKTSRKAKEIFKNKEENEKLYLLALKEETKRNKELKQVKFKNHQAKLNLEKQVSLKREELIEQRRQEAD